MTVRTGRCALVTAIGSFSAHIAIDALRAMGYRVIGCDIYPAAWVANSRDVDAFYQAPLATQGEAYRAFLQDVIEREAVDLVLPSTDYEVDALIGHREELSATVCLSSDETLAVCRDKNATYRALVEASEEACLIPTTLVAQADLDAFAYPAVCKPIDGRSSSGLFTATCADDVRRAVSDADASRYCIQPKLSGRVVTVDVVRQDAQVVAVARRELLRTLNGAGTTVEVFEHEELCALCARIARVLGVAGCVNFEFLEQEDGGFRFLECNPRLSGGVAFSCMAGYDMVANHVRCFEGEQIEPRGAVAPQIIARRYESYRMA